MKSSFHFVLDWDIVPPAQQTDLLRNDVPDIAVRGSRPDFSASDTDSTGGKTPKEIYYPGDDDYKDPNDEESDQEKPECEFGLDCYRKNPAHRKEYKHTHKPQPKRVAKVGAKEKSDTDSDDSFINDEDDGWEPVDDSDEDEDWAPSLSPDYLRHADLSKNRTMY